MLSWTKIKSKVGQRPMSFVWRQVYRIAVITPFLIILKAAEVLVETWRCRPWQGLCRGQIGQTDYTHCVIVTSVVNPTQKALTYASTRSVFNPADRAAQTLQTISSVRAKVPGALVVLLEAGRQSSELVGLAEKVDHYVYLGERRLVRWAVNSRFKSLGETLILLSGWRQIKKTASLYFKISGRYFLDENFEVSAWQTDCFRFFYIRPDFVSTRLYSFGRAVRTQWYFALLKGLPLLLLDYPIEHILARFVPKKNIERVDKAGVMGADATTGTTVKE